MPLAPTDLALLRRLPESTLLALTGFLEARSEPLRGILGVLWVIKNRQAQHPDQTLHDIVLAPYQFSCWNLTDANCVRGLAMAQRLLAREAIRPPDGIIWHICELLADTVLIAPREAPDPVKGATHYYNPDTVTHQPAWADPKTGAEMTARIGSHTFWRHVR